MVFIPEINERGQKDDFGLWSGKFTSYNWYNKKIDNRGKILATPNTFTDRVDNPISDYKQNKFALEDRLDSLWIYYNGLTVGTAAKTLAKKEIDDLKTYIDSVTKKINAMEAAAKKKNNDDDSGDDVDTEPKAQKGIALKDTDLIYNIGCVDSAYFSQSANFANLSNIKLGTKPGIVKNARELWTATKANKGMIVLTIFDKDKGDVDTLVPSGTNNTFMARYGFQFHYNPGSISMAYTGVPPVDINYVATQDDPFNMVGTAGSDVTQSTISFSIVLNRTMDHQYYTVPLNENGNQNGPATLRDPDTTVYSPRNPSAKDQVAIWEKGTMYDVEFLLRTILGFAINTDLRGVTADVGWLTGRPVDVHLGQSLKYRCFISGFNVNHVIFNERMVPIFSTIDLAFNRIPDYVGAGTTDSDIADGQSNATDPGVEGVSAKEWVDPSGGTDNNPTTSY
jgi:hypothetical protein